MRLALASGGPSASRELEVASEPVLDGLRAVAAQRRHHHHVGLTPDTVARMLDAPGHGGLGAVETLARSGLLRASRPTAPGPGPFARRRPPVPDTSTVMARKKDSPPSELGYYDSDRTSQVGVRGAHTRKGSSSSGAESAASTAPIGCSTSTGVRVPCSSPACDCGPCDTGYIDCTIYPIRYDPITGKKMGGVPSTCDRIEEPDFADAGNCKRSLAGAWAGHYFDPSSDTQHLDSLADLLKLIGNALFGDSDASCIGPCADPRSADHVLGLDRTVSTRKFTLWMEQEEPDVRELFELAFAVLLENQDLMDWAGCIVRGYGGMTCEWGVIDEHKGVYIELLDYSDIHADFNAWPAWQVGAWTPADWHFPSTAAGYAGLVGPQLAGLVTGNPFVSLTLTSAGVGYRGIVLIDRWRATGAKNPRYMENLIDLWRSSAKETRAAAVVDLANVLFHELTHVCNTWDDDNARCGRADVVENVFLWGLLHRYSFMGSSPCYVGASGASPFTGTAGSTSSPNSRVFGSNRNFVPHEAGTC